MTHPHAVWAVVPHTSSSSHYHHHYHHASASHAHSPSFMSWQKLILLSKQPSSLHLNCLFLPKFLLTFPPQGFRAGIHPSVPAAPALVPDIRVALLVALVFRTSQSLYLLNGYQLSSSYLRAPSFGVQRTQYALQPEQSRSWLGPVPPSWSADVPQW